MDAPHTEERDRLKVSLDATPLLGLRTGVGAFCSGALGGLARRAELEVSAFAVSWRRRRELGPHLPSGVEGSHRPMPARPLHLSWSHLPGPPVEWFIGATDVVHGTNYVVPPTSRAARVVTVHDLTSVRYPQLCDSPSLSFPRLVRRATREGAWVHTPSRFVAEEVVAELGVDPARVVAVHHGIPGRDDGELLLPQRGGRAAGAGGLSRPPRALSGALPEGVNRYVLAVGTVEPRKDYPMLVRAFDAVALEIDDVALVIAGAPGWGSEAFETALGGLARPDRVVRLGYVADDDLAELLCGAAAVAYPSVYEGFGFVPLEAMAAGVPVVATSAGAIPEVVGDGALLVPCGDAGALCAALVRLLTDDEEAARLVERGLRRAESFTWSACAAGLSALYAQAAR